MGRLVVGAFVVLGLFCLGAGVAMLADGDVTGGVGVGAFGLVMLACAPLFARPRTPEEPLRVATIAAGGREFAGLVLGMSARRAKLALVGSLGFTVAGITFLLDEVSLGGVLCTLVFGLFSVLGVVNVRKGSGHIVVTEDEVAFTRRANATWVRWHDVESVHRFYVRTAAFIRVEGPEETSSPWSELLSRLLRQRGLAIPLSAVGVDPDWLEELLSRCAEDPAERELVARGDVPEHRGTDVDVRPAA